MDSPWVPIILIAVVLGAVIAPVMTVRYLARTGRGPSQDRSQDGD